MNDFAADDLGYRSDGAGRSELMSYIRGEVHEAKDDVTREHGNHKRRKWQGRTWVRPSKDKGRG